MRFVLASRSPARLHTLRAAGLAPEVIVSDVDETGVHEPVAARLAARLATAKAEDVFARLTDDDPVIVIGCDSLLELEVKAYGKPESTDDALRRWYAMRGREGQLHTGHHVIVRREGRVERDTRLATTKVRFADLTDAEIAAYVETGEPANVAGAFTIDGYGGAFITGVFGDPHNVTGLSLPLVRQMLLDLDIAWHTLWASRPPLG